MPALRVFARYLSRTPFHPQWMMPARLVAAEIRGCSGIVLDIGAADGWVGRSLSGRAQYVTLDYPDIALVLYGTRPHVFGDACRLPFADGSVAAVTCYEVIEHVRDPEALISEVARVLVAGGVAEFTMPFLYPIHDAPHDYQRWTRYGWERSLTANQLSLVRMRSGNHPVHAGAVMAALAVSGPLQQLRGWALAWRLPIAATLLLVINLTAKVLGWVWPGWDAMASSYRVLVRKPGG